MWDERPARRGLFQLLLLSSAFFYAYPAYGQKACIDDAICEKGEICKRGFCLKGCRSTSDCLAHEICLNTKCKRRDRCSPGAQRSCYEGARNTEGVGECRSGVQHCLAGGAGWSPCYGQRLPETETCDGLDNDCDGRVDQGVTCQCTPGSKRQCYTGPNRTLGVGMCRAGLQYCEQDRRWGKCLGQQLPRAEICGDNEDNDCNGAVDDGCRRRADALPGQAGVSRFSAGGARVIESPLKRIAQTRVGSSTRSLRAGELRGSMREMPTQLGPGVEALRQRLLGILRDLDAARERLRSTERSLKGR